MGRYLERNMQRDERILYMAELHWIIYYNGLVTTLLGALGGHIGEGFIRRFFGDLLADYTGTAVKMIAIAFVCAGAMQLIIAFIKQISTEVAITNQRVIAKHGFVSTTTFELMITKVEGANIDQTVLGRLFGFGTIMVKGTGGGISPIDHVAKPYVFHARLMEAVRAATQQRGMDASMSGAHD